MEFTTALEFKISSQPFYAFIEKQFTRAIRKTASAMLSAAMQLTFARQKYYNILKFWKSFPTTVFFIYNMVGVNTL